MTADYEIWQAVHSACPADSVCCTVIEDIEVSDLIVRAAATVRLSVDAFIHMALVEHLNRWDRHGAKA